MDNDTKKFEQNPLKLTTERVSVYKMKEEHTSMIQVRLKVIIHK